MSVRKRFSVLGLLVGMIGFLLVATTGSVGANSADSVGQIDFSLSNNSGSWTYDGLTQSHGRQGCRLTTSGADLVSVTGDSTVGSNPYAGLFKGAIGVKDNNEGNGEPCARVDPGQSLTLALGSDITGQGLVANAAQIALSFKFDATAQLDMYRDGSFVRNVSIACDGGSDCGPDSGANDVGIVDVPEGAIFDTIVITSDGAVSLVDELAGTHIHLVLSEVTISGTKFHDRDTDGFKDASGSDEVLSGWQIHAYDSSNALAGSATTDVNGFYEITVAPGTYRICEELQGLPTPFVWDQVALDAATYSPYTWTTDACDTLLSPGSDALGADGHVVSATQDVPNIDFANVQAAEFACTGSQESAAIQQTGAFPGSTISITCIKEGGITVPFDVGALPDEGATQFVTVGLDPQGSNVQDQTIFWAEEPAEYDNDNVLQVKTTKVIFEVGGTPIDVVFCEAGDPQQAPGNPHCLVWQVIELGDAPGNSVSPGNMQLTEFYQYLGDPSNFR